ncbi:MAG: hypothetical protein K0R57_3354 [Paenibacillaceae bacterium]|jgi:hypothetical protein|nr:hypothetical protein [Paenibacillaceae bacterium]
MKRRGGHSNRRYISYGAAGIFVVALVGVCALVLILQKDRSGVDEAHLVASVNGEPVVYGELLMALKKERAQVFAYYQNRYGAEDGPGFWERSYGGTGEVPAVTAKEAALKKLTRLKVEQGLFRQYGLLADPGYEAFLEEVSRENARRLRETAAGRPIYGPRQVEAGSYYELRQSNLAESLKRKLADDGLLEVTEPEVEGYYSARREEFERKGTVRLLRVALPAAKGKDGERRLEEIALRLEEASGPAELDRLCREEAASGITCGEISLGPDSSRSDAMLQPILLSKGGLLQAGELSSLFEENGDLVILRCLSRENDQAAPLEEVKERIRKVLTDGKYEQYLQREEEAAHLEVDQQALDLAPVP